ncbi:MAG: ATP-binding protein, partial [Gammaproteobacteria bacterium]|nr:ATP-binding protein [Gammaproteobacteria bacterium]
LSEELDFIDDYIALEKLRLGERLRFIEDVGETAKACAIQSLLLQPLVENSIHHAVARRADGGKIELAARLNDDELTITLTDDGPGFDPQKITEGRGLSLVKKRLATLYNEPDHLKVSSSPGSGATISISIPYEQTV